RVQPEAIVLDPEDAAGLRDAPLAQHDRLPARRQRLAHRRPLLQRHAQSVHVGHSSWRGDRSINSLAASRGALPWYSTRYTSVMIGVETPSSRAFSWTASAVETPSATLCELAQMASRVSPRARRSPNRRLRPCRLKHVVIRSPSPASPANVAARAPSATPSRVISTRPR